MATTVADRISVEWTPEFASFPPTTKQDGWSLCTVKAPFFEPNARAPVDIVAVIDKSGSMHGDKLNLVKDTLEFVIDQLKECDKLSVVTYDTNVTLTFPLTPMDPANKERTKDMVKRIKSGSSTNLCGGLLKGMSEVVGRTGEKAKVASVLLLTDGLANVGVSNADGIMEEMRKVIDPPGGKAPFEGTVYTFGFGSDHDAKLLESVSTQGGGVYYYIDCKEKIPESFADCLGGLLSVVGQNISLKVSACGENAITNIHTSRPITWKTPNKVCEVSMGDLQSEEQRDILFELLLPALPGPTSDQVISCQLVYFNVITSALDTVDSPLVLERTDAPRGEASKKLDSQRNRILAANALKQARKLAEEGKYEDGKKLLQETTQRIISSISASEEFCQSLLADLAKAGESMKDARVYKSHGAHYMMSKMQAHSAQRSNYVEEDDELAYNPYQNQSRGMFKKAAKSKFSGSK